MICAPEFAVFLFHGYLQANPQIFTKGSDLPPKPLEMPEPDTAAMLVAVAVMEEVEKAQVSEDIGAVKIRGLEVEERKREGRNEGRGSVRSNWSWSGVGLWGG